MDDAIFENIYRETARPLWAYIARISLDGTTADDILQETYLRFLRSPPRETDLAQSRPYLYKIATNLTYDRFRRIKREGFSGTDISTLIDIAQDDAEQRTEMMQVFSRLKQQERSLLWLAYVEGYDHGEIASILNIGPMSVRVLLFRARRRLAQQKGDNEVIKEQTCSNEQAVVALVLVRGNDRDLQRHIVECPACSETAKVVAWMRDLAGQDGPLPHLPSSGILIFKARLAEKRDRVRRAALPMVWMQVAALLIVASGIVFLRFRGGPAASSFIDKMFSPFVSVAPYALLGIIGGVLFCLVAAHLMREPKQKGARRCSHFVPYELKGTFPGAIALQEISLSNKKKKV